MVAGTLGIQERGLNKLYAMLEGLKRAFLEDRFVVELETDHEDSFWEWRNASIFGVIPEHRYVVQQITQRKADENFRINIRPIDVRANAIAAYLAHYGAMNWDRMVILAGPVGRVFELWCSDMGLGPIGDQFMAFNELNLMTNVVDEMEQIDEEVLGQEML